MTRPLSVYGLLAALLLLAVRGYGRMAVSVWLENLPDDLHEQVHGQRDWLVGTVELNDRVDGPLYLNAVAHGPGWLS